MDDICTNVSLNSKFASYLGRLIAHCDAAHEDRGAIVKRCAEKRIYNRVWDRVAPTEYLIDDKHTNSWIQMHHVFLLLLDAKSATLRTFEQCQLFTTFTFDASIAISPEAK